MDQFQLETQLFDTAAERAAAAGRHLGEGAEADLRAMAANGAAYLAGLSDPEDQARQFEQAKADLRRLIDDALGTAQALADYPADLLGEQTYFPAKFRFCPCRPFC